MKAEPSKLARLVIEYRKKFGRHVPDAALRRANAGKFAALLEDSLATGVPISETGWECPPSLAFRLGGCIIREEDSDDEPPTKGPSGEWLQ